MNNFIVKKLSRFAGFLKENLKSIDRWASIRGTSRLRANFGLFAISFAISLTLWAFVAWDGNSDGTRSMSANIEYLNLQRGYSMFDNTRRVELRLVGRITALSRVEQSDISARVDLQGLQPGKYSLPINIGIPPFVRVRSWQPSTADVEIYRHVERTLRVGYRIDGALPEGMVVSAAEIVPQEVTISGPEADVLAVQSIETVVPAAKIRDGMALRLPVRVVGTTGKAERITMTPREIEISVTLENEILGESVPVEVPVVGVPAEGYEVDQIRIMPQHVTIRGKSTSVKQMRSLILPPVDISGLDQDLTLSLPLQPTEINGEIEISGPERARVEISIRRKIADRIFSGVGIMTEGVHAGKEWKLSPQTVELTVRGTKADIDALTSDNPPCELYIDLSNIVSKEITLPVLVRKLKSGIKILRIEPEQVTAMELE